MDVILGKADIKSIGIQYLYNINRAGDKVTKNYRLASRHIFRLLSAEMCRSAIQFKYKQHVINYARAKQHKSISLAIRLICPQSHLPSIS